MASRDMSPALSRSLFDLPSLYRLALLCDGEADAPSDRGPIGPRSEVLRNECDFGTSAGACACRSSARVRYARKPEKQIRRRPGSFDWRQTPGLRCAAPVRAALRVLYARPLRRCPVLQGRRVWGCSRSRQPIGSTTVAVAGCRFASARDVITAIFTAAGCARGLLGVSLCAVQGLAINAPSLDRLDMPSGSDATASDGMP
jgi:hypothetical protein